MSDALTRLFNDFDGGMISRRQLLQVLGLAAIAAPMTKGAVAQGSCGGANASLPRCEKTPFPPPFDPTGFKTVLLDHFSIQAEDYEKEAAYYNALMSWKVRSDDGKMAVLDIGDWGGVEIRGGLVVPPAPTPPPAAAGDSAGGRGGRGGRGGGGGGGGRRVRAVWDSMCWGIEPWDTRTVEAALKARGLNPVADHKGSFQSFHVKDPDGFGVQLSNGNKRNRRTTAANGKLKGPLPFEPTGWKSVWLDHISFSVTSYKESAAFYAALLGWKPGNDEGSQNTMEIAPNIGGIIVRGGNANAPGGLTAGRGGRGGAAGDSAGRQAGPPPPLVRRATINHISFGLADFDYAKVRAELEKRGLNARVDTGGRGEIETARYKSYHTTTPNGWDLQISNTIARESDPTGLLDR